MDTLPTELLVDILIDLPVVDILANCRAVCKRWQLVIDNSLRLRTLIIYDSVRPLESKKEFYTYRQVNCTHCIKNRNLSNDKIELKLPIFINLKQLFINDDLYFDKIDYCEFLNSFEKLESLEVSGLSVRTDGCLSLSNLKILVINFNILSSSTVTFTFDTPKLQKLRLKKCGPRTQLSLKFNYAQLIDYLETNLYENEFKNFSNLTHLICKKIDEIEDDLLKDHWIHLKEIHFNDSIQAYHNLKEQKERFRGRKDLKLYFRNIDFDRLPSNLDLFYDQFSEQQIRLLSENLDKLPAILPFIKIICYEDFERYFTNDIPGDLIRKFVNFRRLWIESVCDQQKFYSFLEDHCKNLVELQIRGSYLGQDFYFNKLTKHCPYLRELVIQNTSDDFDFKFIFQFKYLVELSTTQQMSVQLVRRVFDHFKPFEKLEFYMGTNEIYITYYDDEYELSLRGKNEHFSQHRCLDDLLYRLDQYTLNEQVFEALDEDQASNQLEFINKKNTN